MLPVINNMYTGGGDTQVRKLHVWVEFEGKNACSN